MSYRDPSPRCALCEADLAGASDRCAGLDVCRACYRGRNLDALLTRRIHVQTLELQTTDADSHRHTELHALAACDFALPLDAAFGREGFLGRRFKTDLQTGDAMFDDAIAVRGDDRDVLAALLAYEPVRLAVMDLVEGSEVAIAGGVMTARATTATDLDELRRAATVVAWGMALVAEARGLPCWIPPVLFAPAPQLRVDFLLEIHGDRVDLMLLRETRTPALAIWDAHLASDDLSPLRALPLRSLKLVRVPEVSSLGPLAELADLTSLVLAGCPVDDVSPLARLGALEGLNLARTRVTDLRPLAALQRLRELHVDPPRQEQARALQRVLPSLEVHVDHARAAGSC